MVDIPDDLDNALLEIDAELRAEGVPIHARPIRAIIEFGKRYKISLPLTKSVPVGAPQELVRTSVYSLTIHNWFEEVYGERLKFDPSANAKVAIYVDGDVWQGPLPIVFGGLVAPSRKMPDASGTNDVGPVIYNPCAHLVGMTQNRLSRFTNEDLNEIILMYNLGTEARDAFDRFRKYDLLFTRAEADWAAATMHLTAQSPDFGQSLYASLQMAEKFMKALIGLIGGGDARQTHNLKKLFSEIAKSVHGISHLITLFDALPVISAARYEYPSNVDEAYAAHKASLELVGQLGGIGTPEYHESQLGPR